MSCVRIFCFNNRNLISQTIIWISDTLDYRNLVLWLEDQKIRHYKIEDRKALRDINSSDWPKTFKQYRDDLACPVLSGKPGEQLEWLLAFAVRLEYSDSGK
jgi:RLL motif-containing protein 1